MNSSTDLTVGGVAVSKNTTSTLDSTRRRVSWNFRLNSIFPAGNYTAILSANHLDHILYNVNGVPTELKLLTWKPKSLPIVVN